MRISGARWLYNVQKDYVVIFATKAVSGVDGLPNPSNDISVTINEKSAHTTVRPDDMRSTDPINTTAATHKDGTRTFGRRRSINYTTVLRGMLFQAKHKADRALRLYCSNCAASIFASRCPDSRHINMSCENYAKCLALRQEHELSQHPSSSQNIVSTSTCSVLQNITLSLEPTAAIVEFQERVIFNSNSQTTENEQDLQASYAISDFLGFIKNLSNQACGSASSESLVNGRLSVRNMRLRPSDVTLVLRSLGGSTVRLQNLL